MIWRALIRLWLWLTEERPLKRRSRRYPPGDPPSTTRNWGDAVSRTRRDGPAGMDWADDE